MEHFKKFWWVYLLLAIAIYYFFFSASAPLNYEKYKSGMSKPPLYTGKNPVSINPKPVDGKCPFGYGFNQPECITAPCEGECLPIIIS